MIPSSKSPSRRKEQKAEMFSETAAGEELVMEFLNRGDDIFDLDDIEEALDKGFAAGQQSRQEEITHLKKFGLEEQEKKVKARLETVEEVKARIDKWFGVMS